MQASMSDAACGERRIAALLRHASWLVNDKRVERIWSREGLKVPYKQLKRGHLCLTDGSCIRLRAHCRPVTGCIRDFALATSRNPYQNHQNL